MAFLEECVDFTFNCYNIIPEFNTLPTKIVHLIGEKLADKYDEKSHEQYQLYNKKFKAPSSLQKKNIVLHHPYKLRSLTKKL